MVKFDDKPVDRLSTWKDESGDPTKEIAVWIKDNQVVGKGQLGLIAKPKATEEAAKETEKEQEQKKE